MEDSRSPFRQLLAAHSSTVSSMILNVPNITYNVNMPKSSSLINYIDCFNNRDSRLGSHEEQTILDTILENDDLKEQLPRKDRENDEYWRKLRDIAGPWDSHRFDMDYWQTDKLQTPLPVGEDSNGFLTKDQLKGHLSMLERCPHFEHYAYIKCVLSKMKLTNIDLLKHYQYLQYLDLSGNKLTTLQPLSSLPFLKILDASNNLLKTALDFNPPFYLTFVNLSHNHIRFIKDLTEFWSITHLDLSNNYIRQINGVKHLKYLNHLNLAFNNIQFIKNLEGLTIQSLNLQNNFVQINETDKVFDRVAVKSLRRLNLNYNHVSSLKFLEEANDLESLEIVCNNIGKLLDIYYLRHLNLNRLNLTGNAVTSIQRYIEVCVKHIKHLKILDNEQLNSNYWLEKMSNETEDAELKGAHNRLKLFVLEQLKPPQIWSWIPPYDCPPIAVIVLVGLPTSKRPTIARNFCNLNHDVVLGIPHTTKVKLSHEIDGEHFYFLDDQIFKRKLYNGEFLTYQETLGSSYAIGRYLKRCATINVVLAHEEFKKAQNRIIMLYTDLTMGLALKQKFLNTVLVLAMPSSNELHTQRMNSGYNINVFPNGNLKFVHAPIVRKVGKNEIDLNIIDDIIDILNEIIDGVDNSEQRLSSLDSKKNEKSEIFELWSATQSRTKIQSMMIHPQISAMRTDRDYMEKMKRCVSFTMRNQVHEIQTRDSIIPDQVNQVEEEETPEEEKEPSKEIFLVGKDPRVKMILDDELRLREDLLDLHLHMPGLFRELIITDNDEEAISKLKKLVNDINGYNYTTQQAVLNIENDSFVQSCVDYKLKYCFTELNKDICVSAKQAAEFERTKYPHRCMDGVCGNQTCPRWD